MYAAVYENGRIIRIARQRVPANAGEIQLTLGLRELPAGTVIKAFMLYADSGKPMAENAVWYK